MRLLPLLAALLAATAAQAGPISQFAAKPLSAAFESTRTLEDVERCLIDLDGYPPPSVYRQPDRPDDTTILWPAAGATEAARADLRRTDTGTNVRLWTIPTAAVQKCL